ncbi:MAG: T9SS type A sorting domain-containing protein [Bacteroidota bacterium]
MKKLVLLVLYACSMHTLLAQCIDNFPILTTDPAVNIQLRNGSGKINTWDWTRDIYDDVFITQNQNGTNPICTEIRSPWHFDQMGNPNVVELVRQKLSNPNRLDIYPIDGWELLSKRMGALIPESNGEIRIEHVRNPSFSIYNRRTGHVKFFLYLTKTDHQSARVVNIKLEYTRNLNGRKIVGALLNHRDSLQFILPEFNPNIFQSAQSTFNGAPLNDEACGGAGYWLAADFWVQFDPCTCYPDYATTIRFSFDFIVNSTINMIIDGDINGSVVTDLYNSPVYLSGSSLQKSKFDGILGNVTTLIDGPIKGYKTADGYNDYVMKLVTDKKNAAGNVIKPALFKGAAAKKIAAKGAVFGPKGLLIAAGIGLVHSYIKANKKRKETPKPITYEKNFKVKLTANGNITTNPFSIQEDVFVPGSPTSASSNTYSTPIYNNVLGILSFTELPKLQYANWQLASIPSIRQYKLSNQEIKYLLNPASGLQIESIKAQLVINLDKGKALPGLYVPPYMGYFPPLRGLFQFGRTEYKYCEGDDDFEKQINASGFEITNWPSSAQTYREITFGTPFVDLPCVHDQTFLINEQESPNLRVSIKFHVIFKVVNQFGAVTQPEGPINNSNSEEELIEYVITYPIQIEEEPIDRVNRYLCYGFSLPGEQEIDCIDTDEQWIFVDPSAYKKYLFLKPLSPSPWPNIDNKKVLPVSLNFENTTLSGIQEFKAQKTITVSNNVQVLNGSNILLRAGESIEVSDLFEGHELLQMEIGLDPSMYIGACNPTGYNSTPDLNAICQTNSPYYTRTRTLNKTNETTTPSKQEVEIVKNVSLFPNPVDDFTTVRFDIIKETIISAELLDVKGQVLKTLALNKYYPIGNFELPVNLQELNQGVYIVSFTDENGFKKAYKLVKTQ